MIHSLPIIAAINKNLALHTSSFGSDYPDGSEPEAFFTLRDFKNGRNIRRHFALCIEAVFRARPNRTTNRRHRMGCRLRSAAGLWMVLFARKKDSVSLKHFQNWHSLSAPSPLHNNFGNALSRNFEPVQRRVLSSRANPRTRLA